MGDNVLELNAKIVTNGIEKGFKEISRKTASLSRDISKVGKSITSTVDGLTKKVMGIFKHFVVNKIFGELKKSIESSLRKNKEFADSMKKLRGSMATAFQPIYETIAPAIIKLISLLNLVVQAVGRFIASITGKSYSQMMQNAEALSHQRDQLDGVAGAAANARKQLMGFDEINKLEDTTQNSDTGMIFNEEDLGNLGSALDELGTKFRNLFNAGDFEGAGKLIADFVNEAISKFDLSSLSETVGTWVNNFVTLINGFTDEVDWENLGEKLRTGINTLFQTVDGYKLGKFLATRFKMAVILLTGAVKVFDGSTLGQKLGQAVFGFSDTIYDTFKTHLNSEFYEKLRTNIHDFFYGDGENPGFGEYFIAGVNNAANIIIIALPEIIQTIGSAITDITGVLADALESLNDKEFVEIGNAKDKRFAVYSQMTKFEAFGQKIANSLISIDWKKMLGNVGRGLNALAEGILDFVLSATKNITTEQWREFGEAVFDAFCKIDWVDVLVKTMNAVGSLAIGIVHMIAGAISALKNTDWKEVGDAIIDGFQKITWGDVLVAGIIAAAWAIGGPLGGAIAAVILGATESALSEAAAEETKRRSDGRDAISNLYNQGVAEGWSNADFGEAVIQAAKDNEIHEEELYEYLSEIYSDDVLEQMGFKLGCNAGQRIIEGYEKGSEKASEKVGAIDSVTAAIENAIIEAENNAMAHGGNTNTAAAAVNDAITKMIQDGLDKDEILSRLEKEIKFDDDSLNLIVQTVIDLMENTNSTASATKSAVEGTSSTVKENVTSASEVVVKKAGEATNAVAEFNQAMDEMNKSSLSTSPAFSIGSSMWASSPMSSYGAWTPYQYYGYPHFAEGAVIPPNKEFLAVLGDQKSGNNVEAPESLIRKIVREESGNIGNSNVEALLNELISAVSNIRVGDEVIGRASARYSRNHGRAMG